MSELVGRAVMIGGGGLAAWIGFRMYVRYALLQELLNSRAIEKMATLNTITKMLGVDLNLPTAQRLAESMVPVWDSVMPQEAVTHMLTYGRASKYWPQEYGTEGDLTVFEPVLVAIGRNLYLKSGSSNA